MELETIATITAAAAAGSKGLIKLVDTAVVGVGEIFRPWQTRRMGLAEADRIRELARAEADAKVIAAEGDSRKEEMLAVRAEARSNHLELRRQRNVENVLGIAADEIAPASDDAVSDKPVDEDWVAAFYGNCQDISNERMQILWGKILAGEVKSPGAFSLRTLNTVKTLTQKEAETFAQLCRYLNVVQISTRIGSALFTSDQISNYLIEQNIHWSDVSHMQAIGLVTAEQMTWTVEKQIRIGYGSTLYRLTRNPGPRRSVNGYPLTLTGQELLSVSEAKVDPDFHKVLVRAFQRWHFAVEQSVHHANEPLVWTNANDASDSSQSDPHTESKEE